MTTILEAVKSWVVSTHLTWKRYLKVCQKLETRSLRHEAVVMCCVCRLKMELLIRDVYLVSGPLRTHRP